jgi:hypothetical protein
MSLDLLVGVAGISRYMYGDDSLKNCRRVRHLIARGEIPIVRRGGRVQSRRVWLGQAFAEPDPPPQLNERKHEPEPPPPRICAVPGCCEPVRWAKRGRPPERCARHRQGKVRK